jgi:exonuclease SbcD
MINILHSADWHLGKVVYGTKLIDEQRYVLDAIIDVVDRIRPDVFLLSGDVYDRAVPSAEAIRLFDDVVYRIVHDCGVPMVVVAGNHDHAERLSFGSRFLTRQRVVISGSLDDVFDPFHIAHPHDVYVHRVPYADPLVVHDWLMQHRTRIDEDTRIRTHDEAWEAIISCIAPFIEAHPHAYHIVVAHAFVGSSLTETWTEAERPLSIGGAQSVHPDRFSMFHYTALGHLHRAHAVGNARIRYAGSPYAYAIEEEHHTKSITHIMLDHDVRTELIPLVPQRRLRSVRGTLDDIRTHEGSEDYVFVQLTDTHHILYPMETIRTIYPNALHVQCAPYASDAHALQSLQQPVPATDVRSLFRSFYASVWQTDCDDASVDTFCSWINAVRAEETTT